MIGKLRGLVDSSDGESVIIDVQGVGYVVFASARTLAALPGPGGEAGLLIETHVREDHIHLFGFSDAGERDWFRLLCTVQGVGARHALAILSVLSPHELAQAIAAQDKQAVVRANGVGPKLAGRITAELRDKAGSVALGPAALQTPVKGTDAELGDGNDGQAAAVGEDAVSALTNLGYRRTEAFGAVAAAARRLGDEATVQTLIREGLKELSQ